MPDDDVTLMLQSASEGDTSAASALLPLVYDELRQAVGHLMNAERSDHALKRPRLRKRDRIFGVWLPRLWTGWRPALLVVQPETVVGLHRQG